MQNFVFPASRFSKERLEGRALEHALAGHGGSSVRMRDDRTGEWVQVTTQEAQAAMRYMAGRSKTLVQQLSQRGFKFRSADMPATMHH